MASISKVLKFAGELQELQRQMRLLVSEKDMDPAKAGELLDQQDAVVAKIRAEAKVPRAIPAAS